MVTNHEAIAGVSDDSDEEDSWWENIKHNDIFVCNCFMITAQYQQ